MPRRRSGKNDDDPVSWKVKVAMINCHESESESESKDGKKQEQSQENHYRLAVCTITILPRGRSGKMVMTMCHESENYIKTYTHYPSTVLLY